MHSFRAFLSAGLIGVAAPAIAADAFSTDWSGGLKSSARLIVGDKADGRFHAGVEIKLAPGAITYWRNPGDAGLPPVFSFEGSENLAEAKPAFPPPQRLHEGDGEAFGYDHSVILPIEVAPRDPSKGVTLALKLDYAVCEKICVPAKAALQLRLDAEAGPSPYAEVISSASAATPRPIEWSSLSSKAALTATNDKAWRLCVDATLGAPLDAFVEVDPPWWFAVAHDPAPEAGKSCFLVTLQQKPEDKNLPVAARFTFTGGSGAFETTVALGEARK
jgi:DsbC/DsbD-like thiol-disulfide interchange protein